MAASWMTLATLLANISGKSRRPLIEGLKTVFIRKNRVVFCVSIITSLVVAGSAFAAENSATELWQKMLPKFRSALKLKDKQDTLPDSSLFHEDKKSNQNEINQLLDEAVGILVISDTQTYRRQIESLEADIQEAKKKVVEYEEKRISAPSEKPAWKAWENSKKDYAGKIEDQKERIAKDENEIESVKGALRKELRELGLDVNSEQVDFLLSTIVGDNAIQVIVGFNNVKALTIQLEQLMVQSGGNIETARRYYGMYMVLLEILDRMYHQIIQDIDHKYIPQIVGGKNEKGKNLEGIIPRTEKLTKEANRLLQKDSSVKNREVLSANIRAQKITLEAAKLYRSYLEEQRSDLSAAKEKLAPDLATAQNTYETVKVSSELVAMMKSGQNLFDTLKSLQVPELRVFENLEMKKEFQKLTVQMKSGRS
jgi:hypothetical protein